MLWYTEMIHGSAFRYFSSRSWPALQNAFSAILTQCKFIIIKKIMRTLVSRMGAESEKDPGGIGSQPDCCSPSDIECVRWACVKVTQKKAGFVYVHLMAWEKEWRYNRETVKVLRKI